MTGGLGFSRTGQNSVRQNKDLKNSRSKMKDNPYAATNNVKRNQSILNYKKLRIWKNDKNEKTSRRIIYIVLITILFLFLIVIKITN